MTHRTDQPAQSPIDFSLNQRSRQSISSLCAQGPTPAGRVAGFLLQNVSHPTRQRLYINPAKSAQIRGDTASSQPYLVRFSQIQPFLADFSSFGADFGDFNADLVSFYIFWWWFYRFRQWFCNSDDDLKPTKQTWSPLEPKTDSTNWRWRSVLGHSSFHSTLAGRVWARSKIDPPNPWTPLIIGFKRHSLVE